MAWGGVPGGGGCDRWVLPAPAGGAGCRRCFFCCCGGVRGGCSCDCCCDAPAWRADDCCCCEPSAGCPADCRCRLLSGLPYALAPAPVPARAAPWPPAAPGREEALPRLPGAACAALAAACPACAAPPASAGTPSEMLMAPVPSAQMKDPPKLLKNWRNLFCGLPWCVLRGPTRGVPSRSRGWKRSGTEQPACTHARQRGRSGQGGACNVRWGLAKGETSCCTHMSPSPPLPKCCLLGQIECKQPAQQASRHFMHAGSGCRQGRELVKGPG